MATATDGLSAVPNGGTDEAVSNAVDENVNPDAKKRKTHRLKQRFQVVRKLGQGTYGKVQLAINNETGQEVAIKTIKKSKVENEQDLIRIRREIQIMSSIHHPHIAHIYEVFENKDKIVLVMQYASGGELYDYVSYHKVLSDSDARRLFRQIATAIYYCHKNKICHRDLKLENILLDEKGNAKIADFGLSNVFDEKHFLQTFCGSPLYASPEIVRGLPYFGPEVDCWSLGVLLYTLVYGAMPFDGSNFKKLVKQISESNYYEPPNKSAASDLIRKLLTPNPQERANIITICTDEWVNQDFEHSLLQVAEDLSNLTPVRCDMLVALAPTSPNIFSNDETVLNPAPASADNNGEVTDDSKINKAIDSNKRTVDNTSFNTSPAEVSDKKTSTSKKKSKKASSSENVEDTKKICEKGLSPEKKEIEQAQDETKSAEQIVEQTQANGELPTLGKICPEVEKSTEAINDAPMTSDISSTTINHNDTVENKTESKIIENESGSKLNSGSSSTVSSPKRPGRLSIPKIWDKETAVTASAEKRITGEETPKSEKKVPFIPVGLKVSEAKKVIERRCSVDASKSSLRRRDSVATTSEFNKDKKTREMKKYAGRSLSLNILEASKAKQEPAKKATISTVDDVKKSKSSDKKMVETDTATTKPTTNKPETSFTSDEEPQSKPSTPISEEDKSLAKQIIGKNIARAQLMKKQSISVKSKAETTPLVSIEDSNISIIQKTPKAHLDSESMGASEKLKSVVAENLLPSGEPFNPAPITRSYKKVTFTKDGACITESGKFYTHEGKDGYLTRVEKKSMVTHIISDDPSSINIQRSDSQSSSGSTDIFDDIFDDHWTGNVFSNMKSLFSNIFESTSRRFNERKSLRSRAESLERGNNMSNVDSWLTRRQNRKSLFASEEDDSASSQIFDSQSSLFSKSILNKSFKSSFDRRVEDLISPLTSWREREPLSKIGYPLPKFGNRFSRESSLHRDSDTFGSRFGEMARDERATETNKQDSTRRRVEQWLHSDEGKDLETYGTIGPKNFRRYVHTMSSANDSASNIFKQRHVQMSSSSVNETNLAKEHTVDSLAESSSSTMTANPPKNENEFEIRFTIDNKDGINILRNRSDFKPASAATLAADNASEKSTTTTVDSGIKIAETSSLLEQLRTFGYKNLVSRRLSESSSTEELDVNESSSEINFKSTAGR